MGDEEVKKRRTAARSWASPTTNSLKELCGSKNIERLALKQAIEEVDKRIEKLDSVQSEYELTLEVDALEAEIEEAFAVRDKLKAVRLRAWQLLEPLESANMPDDLESRYSASSQGASSYSKPDVKLPKLTLPRFSGQVIDWFSFWDQFVAVIDRSDLPVSKF